MFKTQKHGGGALAMTYYYTSYYSLSPSDLEHHGIKGMHWGIRRFQYKDGSLTAKGRKRYDVGEMLNESDRRSKITRGRGEYDKDALERAREKADPIGTAFNKRYGIDKVPKAGTTRSMLAPKQESRQPWSEKNDAPQPWSEKPSAKKQSAADRILYGKQKLNKDGTVKSTTANDILSKWDRQEKTQKAVSTGVQAYRALRHIYNFAKVAQGNYQQNTNRGREYYERMARRRGATNITWLD